MSKSQLDQHGVPTIHACPMLKLWWRALNEVANFDDNVANLLSQGWITLSRSRALDSFNTLKLRRYDDPPEDMSAKGNLPLCAHLPCTCGENIAYAITGMKQR
eukprot:12958645-Heterocapsa_arctica.AAC.1